jgi:hypothetical protein
VPIDINRKIFEYDQVLIVGPVFPTRWSAFPAAPNTFFRASPAVNFCTFSTGWGRADCKRIIGVKDTPVRRLIDRAMEK